MNCCEIFMLFPVYEDIESSHYINKIGVISNDEYNDYLSKIKNIIDVFKIENYNGFYDSLNLEAFLSPVLILEDYYPNIITTFRRLMSNWGEDWRNSSVQEEHDEFYYYSIPINNDSFCEIAKRKYNDIKGGILIINHNAFSCSENTIKIKYKDNILFIDSVEAEIKEIAQWFSSNRNPKRIYNWNPKHGENGKGAFVSANGDKVSVLMCSRENVPNMLNCAFGDNVKKLFYYDNNCQQYIEFKRERESEYHAFHLDKNDEKRIPLHIKKIIDDIVR